MKQKKEARVANKCVVCDEMQRLYSKLLSFRKLYKLSSQCSSRSNLRPKYARTLFLIALDSVTLHIHLGWSQSGKTRAEIDIFGATFSSPTFLLRVFANSQKHQKSKLSVSACFTPSTAHNVGW